MVNNLWSDAVGGDELRQRQREIDRAMAQTICHRPYSPQWSGEGKTGPLTEDQVLASVFDGAYSVEQARDLKRRVKALSPEVRAGLLGRLGRLSDRELRDELLDAEGGLSRAAREEWSREQRTVRL